MSKSLKKLVEESREKNQPEVDMSDRGISSMLDVNGLCKFSGQLLSLLGNCSLGRRVSEGHSTSACHLVTCQELGSESLQTTVSSAGTGEPDENFTRGVMQFLLRG